MIAYAQMTIHIPILKSDTQRLCACQREDGYLNTTMCFTEVRDECKLAGVNASGILYCGLDWSQPDALVYNPVIFMSIIRASAVKCKHPFTFSVLELGSFLGAVGTAPYFWSVATFKSEFISQNINGAIMTQLTVSQLTKQLKLNMGDAITFNDVKDVFLSPGPPVNVGASLNIDIPTVQMNFNVKSVSEVDEVRFKFEATVDVVMHWSDINLWAECRANGVNIEIGGCKYVWKPILTYPNGRDIRVAEDRRYLWTDMKHKTVTYQVEVSGTFDAPMDFRKFPMDVHELPIMIAIVDTTADLSWSRFRWSPVVAQLDDRIVRTGGKDTISGWDIKDAYATEHKYLPVDWIQLSGTKGPMRRYLDKTISNDSMEYLEVSAVTCYVTVSRTTIFYMINYIMVIILLTSLSWITFIMNPLELSDRCGIPLTLLLALNVFQLILSELMPKTGYLTPMHEFVIVSTFFTVFAAVETVISNILNKRMVKREYVIERLKGAVNERNATTTWQRAVQSHKLLDVPYTLERLETLITKNIDRGALIVFPIAYAIYTIIVFA